MLLPLPVAREKLETVLLRRPPVVRVPVRGAPGRLAAGRVRAKHPYPERDLSAMDGYALRVGKGPAGGPFSLQRSAFPGRPSDRPRLRVGDAVYVATGAPLPPGADTVVRIESTREEAGHVHLRQPARVGQDILRSGESIGRGDLLLEPGQRIRPVDLGALRALRIRAVPVYRLRAAVLPIGDEFVRPRSRTTRSVPEYLGPIVAGLLDFCDVERVPPLPDDRDSVAAALREAARHNDLVVTIGGSSVGAKDVTKAAVVEVGRLLFEGVTTNVLKRGAVGLVHGTPVVVLPGQVVAAVTVLHEHGLHLLSRMVGRELRDYEEATLDERMVVRHRMDSVYLFRLYGGKASPLPWGVARTTALLRADAFGILSRGRDYRPGDTVRVQRLWSLRGTDPPR